MTQPNEPNELSEPTEPGPMRTDDSRRSDEPETPAEPEAPVEPAPIAPVDPPPADPSPDDPPRADGPPADSPKSTDWREPPWFPPRDKDRREPKANLAAIVVGLIILAVGIYFFLDRTLGVSMPPVRWSSLWPILLIVIGGLVLIRSIQRR
jgi:uncharacterized membrane protein